MSGLTERQRAGAEFVLQLGRALHRYGTPVHRLESVLSAIAKNLRLQAEFLITPTSILAAFGKPLDQHPGLIRVDAGDVNLDKLDKLDRLTHEVATGQVEETQGLGRVRAIEALPAPYGPVVTVVAYGLSSACSARFFDGGLAEVGTALVAGAGVGLLGVLMSDSTSKSRIYALTAAFAAAFIAHALRYVGCGNSIRITLFAGVIVLVPGLTLTVAMAEIATRNLVSGSVRAMSAAGTLLQILVGAQMANALSARVMGAMPPVEHVTLPWWTEPLALLVAGHVFCVLFRANMRFAPPIVAALALAFYGARLGALAFSAELGAGVGAFAVTAGANLWARVSHRSPQIVEVPAILLLVPGSVGLKGITSLYRDNVVSGVGALFSMVLIAASIAAGMLAANAVVSPRRGL